MTSPTAQTTDFTRDVLGRYTCNGLDEALRSADTSVRPDARQFDIVIVGGGSFGSVLAQHLFYADAAHRHRILVLEAGMFVLPEHVQNLPMIGLNVPGPTTVDPGVARNEIWGLPWRTDVPFGFPGLAYCLGGRSIFFGGWSPELLEEETAHWPAGTNADLRTKPLPDNTTGYFEDASRQIGTNVSNDFIFGAMHAAMRQQLFDGINATAVRDAIPLASLPLHLDPSEVPSGQDNLYKLEAPLAVQGRADRSGFFPLNKFSAVPLVMEAARAASFESGGDDVLKRLMVVPGCHVKRLITQQEGTDWRVVALDTNQGIVPLPPHGVVILALGTIESARLAKISFPDLPTANLIGRNLMAHLRSNLTIRIPRTSLAALPAAAKDLQTSALFVKGRRARGDGSNAYFHLQITAAGLDKPGSDSEAQLFKKIPDVDTIHRFHAASDTQVVITIRGIGEMEAQNPDSHVTLAGELDEYGLPRAFVSLHPTDRDNALWDTMDGAADDAALVFAGGHPYEVLGPGGFLPAAANQAASAVVPFAQRRDGLGTTHHEAGTLWMGDNPATSVTNPDGRFHHSPNTYALGPCLYPTIGSPNPMLTCTALARRLGDQLGSPSTPAPDPGFHWLFDGVNTDKWRMSTIKNQPGHDDPGHFIVVDGGLQAITGTDLGLYWHTDPTPPNFILKLEWLRWSDDDNSGVFVRFPDPNSKGYNNTAFVGVDFGFEIQIDQRAAPDGAAIHKTGAIYNFQGPADPNALPVLAPGRWNRYEIRVQGQTYTVTLNGQQITVFNFTEGSDGAHSDRGLPSSNAVPRFIGLQSHTGRVTFRRIQLKAL